MELKHEFTCAYLYGLLTEPRTDVFVVWPPKGNGQSSSASTRHWFARTHN